MGPSRDNAHCARRSPVDATKDAGSIPATSTGTVRSPGTVPGAGAPARRPRPGYRSPPSTGSGWARATGPFRPRQDDDADRRDGGGREPHDGVPVLQPLPEQQVGGRDGRDRVEQDQRRQRPRQRPARVRLLAAELSHDGGDQRAPDGDPGQRVRPSPHVPARAGRPRSGRRRCRRRCRPPRRRPAPRARRARAASPPRPGRRTPRRRPARPASRAGASARGPPAGATRNTARPTGGQGRRRAARPSGAPCGGAPPGWPGRRPGRRPAPVGRRPPAPARGPPPGARCPTPSPAAPTTHFGSVTSRRHRSPLADVLPSAASCCSTAPTAKSTAHSTASSAPAPNPAADLDADSANTGPACPTGAPVRPARAVTPPTTRSSARR